MPTTIDAVADVPRRRRASCLSPQGPDLAPCRPACCSHSEFCPDLRPERGRVGSISARLETIPAPRDELPRRPWSDQMTHLIKMIKEELPCGRSPPVCSSHSTASSRIRRIGTSRTSTTRWARPSTASWPPPTRSCLAARPTTASPVPGPTARPPARKTLPWARRWAMHARSSSRIGISSSAGATPSS
jgi:hypothetical protein